MAVRQQPAAGCMMASRSAIITQAASGVRFNSSSSKSDKKEHEPDSTSKEVLAAEAAAEADRALTQHRAEGEHVAAAAVSGAPTELQRRPVRIYQVRNIVFCSGLCTAQEVPCDGYSLVHTSLNKSENGARSRLDAY